MKTVKDVVALLVSLNSQEGEEAANILLHALATKEIIDDGTLVHVATVGTDAPPTLMNFVMLRPNIDLQNFAGQAMYCRNKGA